MRIARVTVDELRRMMAGDEPPVVLDLRHELDLEAFPAGIPGALRMAPEEIFDRHHELPREREIITYCS